MTRTRWLAVAVLVAFVGVLAATFALSRDDGARNADAVGKESENDSPPEITSTTTAPTTTAPDIVFDPDEVGADGNITRAIPGVADQLRDCEAVQLLPSGLCAATFGDDPDLAIAAIGEHLGPADEDTGWTSPVRTSVGTCPGTAVRAVTWGGLTVIFTENTRAWTTSRDQEFYSWTLTQGLAARELLTLDGAGLGTTASELRGMYGEALDTSPSVGEVDFLVDTSPADLQGRFDDQEDPRVVQIEAASGCHR